MADNMTTISVITPAVDAYFNKLLLVRNKPKLIHALFGDRPTNLPSGHGKTVVWRRWAQLATKTAEVTEGVTPSADLLSKQDIRGTIAQYMGWVMITDVLEFTCENRILNVATSELNDQMHRTEDELIRNVIVSTASVTTASNGEPEVTCLNADDVEIIANSLQDNDAMNIAPQIKASVGQGTAPIASAYWALMHTALNRDLRRCTGFIKTIEYAQQTGVLEAERGTLEEVRFLASSIAHKEGSATEAFPSSAGTYYYIPIIARHAYGVVDLKKANARLIMHPKGSAGSADPGDQRQTAAWKFVNVCRILNDNNIEALRVTKRSD
jgi:N4-gp56 family major capsid protein